MTTFKEIRGTLIKSLSSDPSPAAAGEMWYNSTSQTLKGQLSVTAWSSAPAPAVNVDSFSSGGTQTAAILAGAGGANPPNAAKAEEYDGSSWTALTNMPAAYGYGVSCGTVSDFSHFGGGYPGAQSTVFDWNGSGWTTGAALPAASIEASVCGPGQQALFTGGSSGGITAATHERNGGSWSTTGNLNTARYIASSAGTKADALCSGGYTGSAYATQVESYNGSSWTAETAMPQARGYAGCSGSSSDDQFMFGGTSPATPSVSTTSVKWNGSSWSTDASLSSAKSGLGGFGSSTAALCGGSGNSPGASEEYNDGPATKTFTTS